MDPTSGNTRKVNSGTLFTPEPLVEIDRQAFSTPRKRPSSHIRNDDRISYPAKRPCTDSVISIRKSTNARARGSKHGEQVSKKLDHFHVFSHLPLELRQRIWSYAMAPQIITWRQNQTLPSVLHTCFESRTAWLRHHQIEHWRTTIFDKQTIYVDNSADILLFDGAIPGLKTWVLTPSSIDLERKGGLNYSRWLKEVRRLAMPFSMAMEEFGIQMPTGHKFDVSPFKKLMAWTQNLEELIIVMGRGVGNQKKLTGEDDWIEVGSAKLPTEPWAWRWDEPNFRLDTFEARNLKRVRDVTLRFVKQK